MYRSLILSLFLLLLPAAAAHGGACCLDDDTCADLPEALICDIIYSGTWQGDGSTCSEDASWCVTYYGACCFGDYCEDWVEHDECEMMGGIFWYDECSMMDSSTSRTCCW